MRGSSVISPSSSFLTAFKPRQVLLLEQQQRNLAVQKPMAKNAVELKPEDESILVCSVALWLENKGFSKVLKRFLSATQVEDDNWKAKALNLNEIFSKYQEICTGAHEDLKSQKKQEVGVVNATETNGGAIGTASEEIGSKKKKKKSKGDVAVTDTGRPHEDIATNGKVNGKEDEDQRYKTSDGLSLGDQKSKATKESNDEKFCESTTDHSTKKKKDKKKKKNKLMSEPLDDNENQTDAIPEVTESKHKRETTVDKKSKKRSVEAAEDEVDESKKASKKRKRMAPDENENQLDLEVAVEESKPKKTKSLEEGKDVLKQINPSGANGKSGGQNKEERFQAGQVGSENCNDKQTDENTKSTLNNNGVDKSGQPKSARKQHKNSAEPKTVNAFQRVKVEEVEFVDERLQDNSYWAKDGADIGYGAKAQEVLGQVKGRDFRHEKTKKKRGSYRGGQIDLQSHSVKFNYSDEE
ncbi:Nucleolar and coiled-body phosphoprotein 1 [Sesamum alatum]|uniref:Nucleolar and coiled-body phosphoprotein 1 n=1 Tax=Sesamum alatum TaxID=300844 RepID=A0AAE2CS98_9LAMI|nr:Nucleolar and coiled-body phosphoprotein 1 [Sesamum alatum]